LKGEAVWDQINTFDLINLNFFFNIKWQKTECFVSHEIIW